MDEYPNNITIINAIVFSDRMNSSINNQGIEILTFMARLVQSQATFIVRITADQMRVAARLVYARYRINVLERCSILRINVTGHIRRIRTLNNIEQSPITPLFVIIAIDFDIASIAYTTPENTAVDIAGISDDEAEKGVGIDKDDESQADIIDDDDDDVKDTDYGNVRNTRSKRTTKAAPKSSSKRRKIPKPNHPNPPRRGRPPTHVPE